MTRARPIRPDIATSAAFVALVAGLTIAVAVDERPRARTRRSSGGLFAQNQALEYRVAIGRGAAGGDPDRDQGRVDRRDGEPSVQGRDDRVRRGRRRT